MWLEEYKNTITVTNVVLAVLGTILNLSLFYIKKNKSILTKTNYLCFVLFVLNCIIVIRYIICAQLL